MPNEARVIPLRPQATRPQAARPQATRPGARPAASPVPPERRPPAAREPLWRDLVGDVLRRERLEQERTLKEVAEAARISMPYLSEVERGRKEPSSEVVEAVGGALGLTLLDLTTRISQRLRVATTAPRGPVALAA